MKNSRCIRANQCWLHVPPPGPPCPWALPKCHCLTSSSVIPFFRSGATKQFYPATQSQEWLTSATQTLEVFCFAVTTNIAPAQGWHAILWTFPFLLLKKKGERNREKRKKELKIEIFIESQYNIPLQWKHRGPSKSYKYSTKSCISFPYFFLSCRVPLKVKFLPCMFIVTFEFLYCVLL